MISRSEKISKSMKRLWRDKTFRDRMTKALRNRRTWVLSEETRNRMSKRKFSKAHRRNLRTSHLGKTFVMSASGRKNISKGLLGKRKSPAHRDKIRVAALNRIANAKGPWKDTKPELEVKAVLDSRRVKYLHSHLVCKAVVDFYIPKSNTIIEVDGCYWHGCPKHYPSSSEWVNKQRKRDLIKTRRFRKAEYRVLRVWACQILKLGDRL